MKIKYPNTNCILCAEKHISLAMVLANEVDYISINRQFIIGELCAATLHIYKSYPVLAKLIRDTRHLIQHKKESEVDWVLICNKLNEIIEKL